MYYITTYAHIYAVIYIKQQPIHASDMKKNFIVHKHKLI